MVQIDRFEFNDNVSAELRSVQHYGKNVGENWPVVYILNNEEEAYVGETHHASVRMSQHLANDERRRMTEIRLISDKEFNKSVILDLESYLIQHMGSDGKFRLQNGNHGMQDHDYYDKAKYEETFREIWKKLKKHGLVDHSINEIENSNLFKYSPYKTLGEDQLQAEAEILTAFAQTQESGKNAAIVVRGGAGTGKTILAIYLMKLFADVNNESNPDYDDYYEQDAEFVQAIESLKGIKKIGIVMPQATLKTSIKDVFRGVSGLNSDMVLDPGEVVDNYLKTGVPYDLLIVDEAHRLKCKWRGNMFGNKKFNERTASLGFDKEEGNELDWILKCSRNQILFRDDLQTVRPCDMNGEEFNRITSKNADSTVVELGLSTQWRCEGGNDYINYVRNILSEVEQKPKQFPNYEFVQFKSADDMISRIKELDKEYGLCRCAAGFAWKWKSKKDKNEYDIIIQDKEYRWNSTSDNWIATPNSVNEIGCIHTLQGYDLNYVGLIIGKDITYDVETGEIKANKSNYFDSLGKAGAANDPDALKEYLTNIYLTLMTRGVKGTYLYICDDNLRTYFEQYVKYAD